MTVAEARAAGTEARGRPESGVGERAARKGRRGGSGQLRRVGSQHAQERDRHAGNIAFERRIARAVVDHRHRGGTVPLPAEVRSTKTERVPPDSGAPLASIAVMLLPPARVITAAGKRAVESTAATLTTPLPDAGDPVMYGAGPL